MELILVRKFINNNPMWVIIVTICFASVLITMALVPFAALLLNELVINIARQAAILSVLVPLFVSIPIVSFYRKIIRENIDIIDRLGKDHLTSLLNRHTFIQQYQEKVYELTEQKKSISLIMIDIDNFKKINDTYGHLIGDRVIKDIGTKIKSLVREKDLICRFGGEEFLVVLWDINQQQSFEIGKRIVKSLMGSIQYEGQETFYTVSVGLVYHHECIYSCEELIIQADKQMYKAKAKGKNTLVCNWDKKEILKGEF
jgi:diguanylate cyclase (GGDEF)-like protein